FASDHAGSTFECKLDGPGAATGTFTSCTTPKQYANLADGSYTFSVRATDAAGNVDATPATRSFTLDTAVPAVTLAQPADGRVTPTTPRAARCSTTASRSATTPRTPSATPRPSRPRGSRRWTRAAPSSRATATSSTTTAATR